MIELHACWKCSAEVGISHYEGSNFGGTWAIGCKNCGVGMTVNYFPASNDETKQLIKRALIEEWNKPVSSKTEQGEATDGSTSKD